MGADLARRRDEQADRYRRRELPSQGPPPPVAVVEVDGGRLGTRQSGAGPGVHQPQAKEDKIACLVSMGSAVHAADPQPEPPAAFRDARRVARLVRQFQGQAPPTDEAAADAPPAASEADDQDPRQVVTDVRRYLWNHRERMDYPRYRRAGLPVTSSWVESLVGEFNGRVKGRDKYWNRSAGAEAILQVRAAVLSEDGRLTRYFADRPGNPYRRRQAVP